MAAVTVVILAVTTLPYVCAVLSAPPDKRFMGFVLDVADHAQYLAWYRGFQDALLIPNTLTPELNAPVYFNLLWLTLGRLGYATGLHYALVYQLFRWLAGSFFLAMTYAFVALLFDEVRHRRFAFMVIALGSGLGWVLVALKYTLTPGRLLYPLDIYIAEGNSFLCLMAYPHFAEAAGLILAVFWLLLVGERRRRHQLRYAVAAGAVAQLLGWQHGYDLILVWGIPVAYVILRYLCDRQLPTYWVKAIAIVGALSWPPAVYAVWLTNRHQLWERVLRQYANAGVYSPMPLHMVVYMGVPLVVALLALVWWARNRPGGQPDASSRHNVEVFVIAWFFAGWLLAYLPTVFQVHLLNGWQVPVALLATIGCIRFLVPQQWRGRRAERFALAGFVLLVVPTNLYLLAWRFYDLGRHNYPYYLDRDDVVALQWIDAHAIDQPVVLSAYDTGGFVPVLAGGRAFLGHWAMTVDFYTKRDLVAEFFAAATTEDRRAQILGQYRVDYVLHGPAEARLGSYDPQQSPLLTRVFASAHTEVYLVRRQETAAGAGWSAPTPASGDVDRSEAPSWFPDVLVDRSTLAHLFWVSWRKEADNPHGGYDSVVHCLVTAGECSAPTEILTFDWWGGINATRPVAAVDDRDQIHVLARGMTGVGGRVHLYHSSTAAAQAVGPGAWSTPVQVSGEGSASYAAIVADQQGTIHIAWSEQVPAPPERRSPTCAAYAHIFYRRSTDRGETWSAATDLTPASAVAEKPQLILSAENGVHLLWEEGPGPYSCNTVDPVGAAIVSSSDHGITWSAPTMFVAPHDAPQRPAAAYDGQSLVVIWGLLKSKDVFYQRSSDGGRSWSAPQTIPEVRSRALENDLDTYHMAADQRGHVHAVLVGRRVQDPPDTSSVLHVEWNGSEWAAPQVIFTSDGDVPEWPRIAVAADGTLHVVWYVRDAAHVWQSNGGRYRVWHAQHQGTPVVQPRPPVHDDVRG